MNKAISCEIDTVLLIKTERLYREYITCLQGFFLVKRHKYHEYG